MESPIIESKRYLDFYNAIREVSLGKMVSRSEWGSEEEYIFLKDDNLCIHHSDNKDYIWQVRGVDMQGEDYFVIPIKN